ncbi:MmcQ/YjbR family DNA-binding protein [Shewanella eurypsychrophilus]|uniref:MmcQ/YjbR family DNA-binding protein n=1 Tax=Shewanella eurypsychrophilus TaxID=2593656 RepID=A0ABX6V8V2_9GAMM|nr:MULTISPECIES: MmcQ/YjbR family DNA-binding protein [Shewanella]QFU23863.1 MmcQ/YjbR family DNA-binding protein [Shewanella sp. YLB-09]QPG59085.1 MmcQ/YjbR family DNA-binding protein [Shewanella eurypsychrophilus]
MEFETAKQYLLTKPHTLVDFPFGADVYVFKVKNKMFATLAIGKMGKGDEEGNKHWWMNLKCDPDEAAILRDIFPSVIPGYHMNKALWNTIILDGSIPSGEIERMIDNSFQLVVAKMTKKMQASILLHL